MCQKSQILIFSFKTTKGRVQTKNKSVSRQTVMTEPKCNEGSNIKPREVNIKKSMKIEGYRNQ